MPKDVLWRAGSFVSVTTSCLIIAGATAPWLTFQAPNVPLLSFGLLTFCSQGSCVPMSQNPLGPGGVDVCQLTVTAAFLFVAFIFSVFSAMSGLSLAIGSEVAIADIKVKVVLSLSTLLLSFIGTVIGCNQVRRESTPGSYVFIICGFFFVASTRGSPLLLPTPLPLHVFLTAAQQVGNFYNSQNNQYIALDSAPKYVFQAGFSCTIAGLILAFIAAVIDLVASRQKDSVTGKLPTFRSSPSHIEYHGDHHMERGGYQVTTSPMAQLPYGGSPARMMQIQNVAPPGL